MQSVGMDKFDDSSYSPYAKTSRDEPNPLRPYYIPPSIGLHSGSFPTSPPSCTQTKSRSKSDLGQLFFDVDYSDYLASGNASVVDLAKKLLEQASWNYTSVLLAQPFEVAKAVLQVHDAGSVVVSSQAVGAARTKDEGASPRPHSTRDYMHPDGNGDSDSDPGSEAPSYFLHSSREKSSPNRAWQRTDDSRQNTNQPQHGLSSPAAATIQLTGSHSVLEVISQLWSKESGFGIWKGTNSSFIYGLMLKTIETWTRTCLSAILDIPDPILLNSALVPRTGNGPTILDSASPLATLGVVVAAAALTGCLLAPIDIIRTRLMITPNSAQPRALLPCLRSLPSLTCPTTVLPITILHSTIPSLVHTSLPLLFRNFLYIDPVHTPSTYSLSAFIVSLAELFIRLPLETILRRGHVHVLQTASVSPEAASPRGFGSASTDRSRGRGGSNDNGPELLPLHSTGLSNGKTSRFQPMMATAPYRGIIGSLLYIVYEEGSRPSQSSARTDNARSGRQPGHESKHASGRKPGQGLIGLCRGWRVGFWGIIGIYAAAGLGSGASGGEF